MLPNHQFSQREQEVVEQLLQGKINKEIALALGISERTVEFHLKNVYAKLQVHSRTEAVLKLGKSTGVEHAESTVVENGESAENAGKPIRVRRLPMKTILSIAGAGLLTLLLIVATVLANLPAANAGVLPSATETVTSTPVIEKSTPAPPAVVSSKEKERIVDQIRQLATKYDQAVQAEKKTGRVQFSQDPQAGEEVCSFQDASYATISELHTQFLLEKTRLEQIYTQLYRDETQPTPFPTQTSFEQDQAYYAYLMAQSDQYCSLETWQKNVDSESVMVYNPEAGKYQPIFIGEVIARCDLYGQMLEEFRSAPWLAKVNQPADMALIRQVTGSPDLRLSFQTVQSLTNAAGRNAAVYVDETGTNYYVDIETARLTQIEPHFPTHPELVADNSLDLGALRTVAEEFALANSPHLKELKSALVYEEGNKGNFYFFTWSYRNQDWSGTDWARMPPLIQVGVLANGQIAIYINTLDLFK